ncbi:MAG: ArnT family glycosyltransferase [Chloroflexota bacterium]
MAGLKQERQRHRPALLLFLLLALPITVLIWRYQFDGLYGQDAYAYYGYASGPLRHSLLAFDALPPFYWPPGFPLLVALTSLVTGITPLAGQIVSLVSGGLVVVFTGLLALEFCEDARNPISLRNRISGTVPLAALIVALTPQLWQSSAVVMPDTTALASATLGVWALARYGRVGRGRWLALASGAVSFAVLTRLAYAPLALPCTLFALWVLARRPRAERVLHGAAGIVVALVVLSPLLVSLVQTSDFLEKSDVSNDAPFLGNLGDVPWDVHHALQREFVTPSGRQQYALANGVYYALTPAHGYYFTPLLVPFLPIGLWRLGKRRRPAEVLLLVGWPAVIYLSLVGYPFQNFRFTLGFLPPLAIIVAGGIQGVASNWREFSRIFPRKTMPAIRANSRKFGAIILVYLPLAGAFLWMAYGGWTLSERFMVRKQGEVATVRWVEEQVEPGAQLYTFAITLAFEQYSELEVHDLYGLDPAQIAVLLEDGESGASSAAYLLVDVPNVDTQWAQHAPGRNYRWLDEKVGLMRRGQHRRYTLFRIEQDSDHGPP